MPEMTTTQNVHKNVEDDDDDDNSYSSGDSAVAFALMDFAGVDFGGGDDDDDEDGGGSGDDIGKTGAPKIEGGIAGTEIEGNDISDGSPVVVDKERLSSSEKKDSSTINLEVRGDTDDYSPTTINPYSASLRKLIVDRVHPKKSGTEMDDQDRIAVSIEHFILCKDCYVPGISNDGDDDKTDDDDDGGVGVDDDALLLTSDDSDSETVRRVRTIAKQLAEGQYVDILCGPTSDSLFPTTHNNNDDNDGTVARYIRSLAMEYCTDVSRCVEVELFAVAALNLFLQVNYTGPSFHSGLVRPGHDGNNDSNDDDDDGGKKDTKRDVMEAALRLLEGINPHPIFASHLNVSSGTTADNAEKEKQEGEKKKDGNREDSVVVAVDVPFQNAVLSELAADGEWPCPVCQYPYFLLLARSILLTLSDPNRPDWSYSTTTGNQHQHTTIEDEEDEELMEFQEPNDRSHLLLGNGASSSGTTQHPSTLTTTTYSPPTVQFVTLCHNLTWADLYSARAGVAHLRLLQAEDLPPTLWKEVRSTFCRCLHAHCPSSSGDDDRAARVALEFGLAEHHFDVEGKGKASFRKALAFSGLMVEVTGAEGKRTKYQTKATAQMLVRAEPRNDGKNGKDIEKVEKQLDNNNKEEEEKQSDTSSTNDNTTSTPQNRVENQMIQHEEDTILLNKIKYESNSDNVHHHLSILHQVILLSLCLDVKNDNPMDGLTGEQMGAFLERILQQHDDWMVYATALLERAWLEADRNHTRQRALLQIQALADQHTNRLTLTQSTFQAAVEDSEPAQGRLRNLHRIVYPPRWEVLSDLAVRYAKIGIVTTAAELFEEIERWDDVVECYRRAGKENKAEEVIRRRLEEAEETPRMWAALGDIKNDPEYYRKALQLSNGKFSGAYVALGKFHSDKGELNEARDFFKEAVRLKPLSSHVWFRLGTICMALKDWELALLAFSKVVQQEPEEADAWANVAAIHMHNKNPAEAFPALVESLKLNRNNWRVWNSKLYTCMDLKRYDEAIQASITLINLRTERNSSENIPPPEERVIRSIVAGAITQFEEAQQQRGASSGNDGIYNKVESSKRTISRVRELLSKVKSSVKNEPWIFETCAFFDGKVGRKDQVVEDLMKEYRALQNIYGWESDSVALPRVCGVLSQLLELHIEEGKIESMKKFKLLVNGVLRRVKAAYFDLNRLPKDASDLETILRGVEAQILKMR